MSVTTRTLRERTKRSQTRSSENTLPCSCTKPQDSTTSTICQESADGSCPSDSKSITTKTFKWYERFTSDLGHLMTSVLGR